MEPMEKIEANKSNDNSKQLTSKIVSDNSKNVCSPKKKFCNTVFATKMRNRKNKDKLNNLNTDEALTTCKSVSIDVTRLSANTVPKLVSKVDRKNRKKKRFQWRLGILTKKHIKKKKPCDTVNRNISLNEQVNESSNTDVCLKNLVDSKNLENEDKPERKEKIQNKLDVTVSKDLQKRKNNKDNMFSLNEKWDSELESDFGWQVLEKYSCRRTEPFVGKLNTKEARCQNLNNILNEEIGIVQTAEKENATVENEKTDLIKKNETKNKNSENLENPIDIEKKNKKSNNNLERDQSVQASDSKQNIISKQDKSKATENIKFDCSINKEKELVNQESNILPVTKRTQTKESAVEIISCRRTIPFVGKTLRKPPMGVSERPIEIDCTVNNAKTTVDSACEDVNKLHSTSVHENDNQNLLKDKSESSDLHQNSESLENKSEMKSSTILNDTVKNSVSNEKSNVPINEVKETKKNTNNKTNCKSDYIATNVESKSMEFLVDSPKEEVWSCRRTEPYVVKESPPHCSRTLPYTPSVNKKKDLDISGSTTDSSKVENTIPEKIPDRLILNTVNDSIDQLNQSKNTSIPVNQEDELIKHITDTFDVTENEGNTSTSNSLEKNGDWKFKRKRIKCQLDNNNDQMENPCKRTKIKLSSTSTSPDERAICSWISFNCTKHSHDHLDISNCLESNTESKNICVSLFRLEHSKDPLVVDYLKKTEFICKNKMNQLSPMKKIDDSDVLNKNVDNSTLEVPEISDRKHETKDHSTFAIAETTNKMNSSNAETVNNLKVQDNINEQTEIDSSNESIKGSKTKLRRKTLSTSSDSLNIIHRKRKKPCINYIENNSDSDSSSNSFSVPFRTRQQNQGRVLRPRDKYRSSSISEADENDSESDKLLHNRERRLKRKVIFESDDNETDNEDSITVETQKLTSKSNKCKIDHYETERIQQEISNMVDQNIRETLTTLVDNEDKNEEVLYNQNQEHVQLNKETDVLLQNETVKKNNLELKTSTLSNPITETSNASLNNEQLSQMDIVQSPIKSLQSTREQSLSTLKSTTSDINSSSKISRASINNDILFETPKKAVYSSQSNERNISISSDRLNTTLNSSPHARNNELADEDRCRAGSNSLSSAKFKYIDKNTNLGNLKVQLIKLEAVCESFEDYSASEIEVLTEKYIDLLMNPNLSSNTWRKPINYHKLRNEKYVKQVNNSDYIRIVESRSLVPNQFENCNSVGEIESVIVTPSIESFIGENHMDTTSQNYYLSELSSVETPHQTENSEQRNFGAVNISEALSVPTNNENGKEKDVEKNEVEVNNGNKTQIEDSELKTATIVVNGTVMFACSSCNNIYITEDLLKEHEKDQHETNHKSIDNEIAKSSGKSNKIEMSETKKQSSKTKKKHSYNESLRCTICSVLFDSKESLFDHIMTHNEHELQEAYKTAKAKAKKYEKEMENNMSEDSDKEQQHDANISQGKKKKKKKEKNKRKSTDSIRNSRSSVEVEDPPKDDAQFAVIRTSALSEHHQQHDLSLAENYTAVQVISDNRPTDKPITICPCHAHEASNQDLQIEMVLFCKSCYVIFRRLECFEVHYRTSIECRHKRTNNEITKVPKLFCSGCPCVLDSLTEMRSHLEMHAKQNCQGTVTFICNICKAAFFGVGSIFYSHWFNHVKFPNLVASRNSFPKLSVVSVLEDSYGSMTTSKSQEGFFYIAEHVCRQCRLPFSSEPELQKHELLPCQILQPVVPRLEIHENNHLQMIKLICGLCKKFHVDKEGFDRHCIERNHLKTPIAKFSRLPINVNEQALVCSLCRVASNTVEDMKEHWKRIHSPIMELYTCKTCNIVPSNDVTNYTYDKFERHCRLVHKSEVITCLVYFVTARYVCDICKFGFETEKSLKEHQIIHQRKSSAPLISNIPTNSIPTNTQVISVLSNIPSFLSGSHAENSRHVHTVHTPNSMHMLTSSCIAETNMQNNSSGTGKTNEIINMPLNSITSDSASMVTSQTKNSNANELLRSMLASRVEDQIQHVNQNKSNIETILIDSRSNSPTLDRGTSDTDNTIRNNQIIVELPTAPQKSYMTMVNPNFESILGSNRDAPNSDAVRSGNDPLDSNNLNLKDNAGISEESPQPFEVVLLTDDLNENSNSVETPVSDNVAQTTNTSISNQSDANQQNLSRPASVETNENSTKSFLRVRSIAELQRIKIHLCSTCGLSFDTLEALELHLPQHIATSSQISNEVGRATPVQMISPMVSQNKEPANAQSILLSQMKQKMAMLTPNSQRSPNNLDVNARMSPSLLPNSTYFHQQQTQQQQLQHQQQQQLQQQQSQQHQQGYWFASCNGTGNNIAPSINYNTYRQQQQAASHRRQANQITNEVGAGYATYSGVPPPYPGNSNSITTGRTGAIQLPERNTPGSGSPTKRPSGAATRIPQQSLPSFEELTEYRQPGIRMSYNCNSVNDTSRQNSSPVIARLQSSTSRPNSQFSGKTYSRQTNDINYSNNSSNISKNSQQQQSQTKFIYNCKVANCNFRTEYVNLFRSHEKTHMAHQQSTLTSTNNQIGQVNVSQQQRLPMKHVPVSQMPERTRHALPSTIANNRNSVIHSTNKRISCRVCRIYFNSKRELIDHVTANHSSQSNQVCCYVCDYCITPLIFETEDLLRIHMNVSHNHFCELCNKRYPSREDLMIHSEVHSRNPR